MTLKDRSAFAIGLTVWMTATMIAQSSAIAVWPLTNPAIGGSGQSVQVSGPIQAAEEYLAGTLLINQYTGPNNSQRIKLNLWPVNQLTQIDTVYIQYVVRPAPSYTLKIDSVMLSLGANSTQDMMANLYYSKDSTFTTKTKVEYLTSVAARVGKPAGAFLSSTKLDIVRVSPGLVINQGESYYFRIYPWVDSSASVSGKYICPQNVVVYATASAVPVSASATWPFTTHENPVVSGLLNAGVLSYAGGLYKYGFNTNGDRWTINNGPQGSGSWPKENSPNFSRYAQFAVSPKTGGTFYSDSVKFSQIVEFTNNLRVAIYTSKDTSFSVKKFVADTAVPANKTRYAYAIPDTVPTGGTLYVRFYPYDTSADPAWKLVDISGVSITGFTTGLAILSPTVSTSASSYVSTTFATSGGTVTSDGGSTVTAKGVCWNTSGNPTTGDGRTNDGTGIGSFVSNVTGLKAGTKYYVRAYATNAGGTAYGGVDSLTTLTAVTTPAVTTGAITNILVKTAAGGGAVTDWGGDSVKVRGICWNTTGAPTITSTKTTDGSGLGSFTSGMTGLAATTRYYVRAYATNTAGTAYGNEVTFTTQTAQRDTTVIVALDGSGHYRTVQAAFRAVPTNYTGKWTIFVKKGRYHEKDTLAAGQVNVVLVGEDRDSTVIWNDDYGDKYGSGNPGTSGTFTVTIDADDFVAKNITIQNAYAPQTGVSGSQAVALSANGDRQEYINVALRGYQDTYYTRGSRATGRTYHKNCIIEGTVDFIFGRNIAVFDSCTIRELRNGGTLTAASTEATSRYGYVFRNCKIVSDSIGYDGAAITGFYLGRPWQASPRTVFLGCSMPANLHPAGWMAWNVTPALYAEFKSFGPGAASAGRVSWSSQLSASVAAGYSLTAMFAKSAASSSLILYDWKPTSATQADDMPLVTSVETGANETIPDGFSLAQNYPNPFNPTTAISYQLSAVSFVTLRVYDVLGREVETLVNEVLRPGAYITRWDGSAFPSGVYFYSLQAGDFSATRKMSLIK